MRLSRLILATAALALSTQAMAVTNPYVGRYTSKKGDCSEEYRVDVTPKSFNRYEDFCRITKSETRPDYNKKPVTYLDVKCSSEGEVDYREIWLQSGDHKGTIEEYYPRESPDRTVVLYQCR